MTVQNMGVCVKILIFIILIAIGGQLSADKEPEYIKHVDEVTADFIREMQKKHKLEAYGSGGHMPHDVKKIEVFFNCFQHATVEEARKLIVSCVETLIQKMNAHEKIRPFLRNYPCGTKNVGIRIVFRTKNGERPLDGSVAMVSLASTKNRLFYDAAEIQVKKPIPYTYFNEKREEVEALMGGGPEVELIDMMDEPYDEALKILGVVPCHENPPKDLKPSGI